MRSAFPSAFPDSTVGLLRATRERVAMCSPDAAQRNPGAPVTVHSPDSASGAIRATERPLP